MATSLAGPPLAVRALATAPVPRPPHPTSAMRIVLFSAACTWGNANPANADTAAIVPVLLRKLRRDVRRSLLSFMAGVLRKVVRW